MGIRMMVEKGDHEMLAAVMYLVIPKVKSIVRKNVTGTGRIVIHHVRLAIDASGAPALTTNFLLRKSLPRSQRIIA